MRRSLTARESQLAAERKVDGDWGSLPSAYWWLASSNYVERGWEFVNRRDGFVQDNAENNIPFDAIFAVTYSMCSINGGDGDDSDGG